MTVHFSRRSNFQFQPRTAVVAAPAPAVGNSGFIVNSFGGGQASADSSAFDTTTGLLLAAIGRGTITDFGSTTVSDNNGNTLALSGSSHNYGAEWPNSGTACFLKFGAAGRSGCIVSDSKPTDGDECTLLAINLLNVTQLETSSFVYRPTGPTNAGTDITVSRPSVLVTVWSGNDATGETNPQPSAGWVRRQFTNLTNGLHVQMALATQVVAAGTYGVTWTPAIAQGGQVYILGFN